MSRREDLRLAASMIGALAGAGVLRPRPPRRLRAAIREGRALGMTPAASPAIGAALHPDAPAVIDEAGTLSWRDLDARVRALAAGLAEQHGAGAQHPVAVMCRNHAGAVVAMAAAARTGGDVLLLSTELSAPQLQRTLAGHRPAAVIADDEFAGHLEGLGVPRATTGLRGRTSESGGPGRRSRIVILTSGTTGTPKAAARDLPPRAMAGPILVMLRDFGLRRGEPVFVGPPLYHGFGLGLASVAQAIGAPLVLRPRFDPAATLDAIEEHRVGCLVAVPVMLDRMLRAGTRGRDLTSLRSVVSAGAPLSPALAQRCLDAFGDKLFNAYGTTETGFGAYATPADLRAAPGTIGRPPPGTTLHVLDDERRPLPAGVTGHLFVGGALVIDGYVGGGSKERLGALMNTGDLGHVDTAGRLFVDGREDDMIVSGGENVFPQEVEDVLAGHPSVADVAVVGVSDEEWGQRLRAFVVRDGGPEVTGEDLLGHVRSRLERFKVPREVVFCDAIPRTATGKTLRRELESA